MSGTKQGFFLCPHCRTAHGLRSAICPQTGKSLVDEGAKAPRNDRRGSVLDGKYRLLEELGKGPSGVVYEADEIGTGRRVAVKMLRDRSSDERLLSLRRMMELLGGLRHQSISLFLHVGSVESGRTYLVMERLNGVSLGDRLEAAGVQSEGDVGEVLRQVLFALHAAHQLGLVHGALSPNNVVLEERPNQPPLVKLLDFGGHSPGTPGYLAPEQLRGEAISRRTDIWACGVLLYKMLTGRRPFRSAEVADLETPLAPRHPVPPSEVHYGLPAAWDSVIVRALETSSKDRFGDALTFARALPELSARKVRLPALYDSHADLHAVNPASAPDRTAEDLAFMLTAPGQSAARARLPSLHDDAGPDADAGETQRDRPAASTQSPSRRSREAAEQLVGREIAGKFTIDKALGEGASGTVYHGVHKALGREVAIKILHVQNRSDSEFVRRFRGEARVASKLDHVNITRVLDFGEEKDGLLYLVMEYLDAGSLEALIERDGRLPALRAARIGMQVCRALRVAHKRGIVHRDIKPANILLASHDDDDGDQPDLVKVCDFGTAKLKQPDPELGELTKVGTLCGSPAYMAPEQARGEVPDARSDIYALGATLYEALTGRLPFPAETLMVLFARHQTDIPAPVSTLVPDIDPRLDAIVLRMLEKLPSDRYESAHAVEIALGEVAAQVALSERSLVAKTSDAAFLRSILAAIQAHLSSLRGNAKVRELVAQTRKYQVSLDAWVAYTPTDAQRRALIECVNDLRVEAFSLDAGDGAPGGPSGPDA